MRDINANPFDSLLQPSVKRPERKYIGEINGVAWYTDTRVPESKVWIEDCSRPNPWYAGGLLESPNLDCRRVALVHPKGSKRKFIEIKNGVRKNEE